MREGVAVDGAISAFLEDLQIAGRSPATIRSYRSYLKPLLAFESLEGADVRGLILDRHQVNPRTALTVFGVLSSFYKWCLAHRYVSASPMDGVPWPQPQPPEHRYLSVAELRRVYAAAGSDDTRLIVELLMLGLRARELLGLRWGDVDLDTGEIRVRAGKGGRPRRVLADPVLVAMLSAQAADGAVVACSYDSLRERIMRLGARAGVPWLRPHGFRRTWASHGLIRGMNATSLQTLGGWRGMKMVQYYARSALEEAALEDARRMQLSRRLLD